MPNISMRIKELHRLINLDMVGHPEPHQKKVIIERDMGTISVNTCCSIFSIIEALKKMIHSVY